MTFRNHTKMIQGPRQQTTNSHTNTNTTLPTRNTTTTHRNFSTLNNRNRTIFPPIFKAIMRFITLGINLCTQRRPRRTNTTHRLTPHNRRKHRRTRKNQTLFQFRINSIQHTRRTTHFPHQTRIKRQTFSYLLTNHTRKFFFQNTRRTQPKKLIILRAIKEYFTSCIACRHAFDETLLFYFPRRNTKIPSSKLIHMFIITNKQIPLRINGVMNGINTYSQISANYIFIFFKITSCPWFKYHHARLDSLAIGFIDHIYITLRINRNTTFTRILNLFWFFVPALSKASYQFPTI